MVVFIWTVDKNSYYCSTQCNPTQFSHLTASLVPLPSSSPGSHVPVAADDAKSSHWVAGVSIESEMCQPEGMGIQILERSPHRSPRGRPAAIVARLVCCGRTPQQPRARYQRILLLPSPRGRAMPEGQNHLTDVHL